jgi:hypothetical protein
VHEVDRSAEAQAGDAGPVSRRPEYVMTLWVSPQLLERDPSLEPGLLDLGQTSRQLEATPEAGPETEPELAAEAEAELEAW